MFINNTDLREPIVCKGVHVENKMMSVDDSFSASQKVFLHKANLVR